MDQRTREFADDIAARIREKAGDILCSTRSEKYILNLYRLLPDDQKRTVVVFMEQAARAAGVTEAERRQCIS